MKRPLARVREHVRVFKLANTAEVELDIYRKTKAPALLDSAIDRLEELLRLTAEDDTIRATRLAALADAYRTRYEAAQHDGDLDRGLRLAEQATALRPATGLGTIQASTVHATLLFLKAVHTDDLVDIGEAFDAWERVRADIPDGLPQKASILAVADGHTAGLLACRSRHTDAVTDLEEAVRLARTALSSGHLDDHDRSGVTANLAVVLSELADRQADATLARRAVAVAREALDLPDSNRNGWFEKRVNLALLLRISYELGGDRDELDEAASIAAAATEEDVVNLRSPRAAWRLNTLACVLVRRYEADHSHRDLDRAVALFRTLVAHPQLSVEDRRMVMANLAVALGDQARMADDIPTLEEAIQWVSYTISDLQPKVADEAGPAFPFFRTLLAQHASLLRRRFELTGDTRDLDTAEMKARRAVDCTDPVERGTNANSLALVLMTQARRREMTTDERSERLDEAIYHFQASVATSTSNGQWRTRARLNLADGLLLRHSIHHSPSDHAEALALLHTAAKGTSETSLTRLKAAQAWARAASGHEDAFAGYDLALTLLPQVLLTGIERTSQEAVLAECRNLGVEAASRAIGAGEPARALDFLERGRGVLWSHSLRFTADLDRLRQSRKKLADEWLAVHAAISHAETHDRMVLGGTDHVGDRLHALAVKRTAVLAKIRALPDFADFQRLPDVVSLSRLGDRGTVIALVPSARRCDALIIDRNGVRSVPLPTTHDMVIDQTQRLFDALSAKDRTSDDEFAAVLAWLYTDIAGPALDAAGIPARSHPATAPRVWWCPSGVLSFLPLHAAGIHSTKDQPAPRTVLDRAVSSYLPTVRELASRSEAPVSLAEALVVRPPNNPYLHGARLETDDLRRRVPHTHVLLEQQARADAVLDVLPTLTWVHFACHGSQDPQAPSHAGLVLADRKLTLREIAACRIKPGAVAVISACDTARGGLALADEALTLAAAAQFAGFDHVIGSLYVLADMTAAETMRRFYNPFVNDRNDLPDVARALHAAVWTTRDRANGQNALRWASLVHVGL